jgi:hypothetical protein
MVLRRALLVALLLSSASLLTSKPARAQPQFPVQAPITNSLTSTTCPGVGCVILNVTNAGAVGVQITGTWVGTVSFLGSVDRVNYSAVNCTPPNSTTAATTTTANGTWTCGIAGLGQVEIAFTAYTSGTAVVTVQASEAGGGGGGGGGGGAASSVTINDPSVTTQKLAINASGQASVTCANCSGSGASAVDNAAFTLGAGSGAPSMGYYNVANQAMTSGRAGLPGMDINRNLFSVLHDAAGNLRGANVSAGNALLVDASATTQPVSGTVAATESGTWTVQPGNTANTTAWKVDGSAVTQPVSGTVTTTPPANASTNVAQLAGTATSVNSGVKDAGTLRVVLATDQPALTNKLLVTPDSVALPANQSVNVAQLAGTATSVNSGVKDAGTLRVVLATDQVQLTNKLLVTPDSVALPANQSVNVAQVNGVATLTGVGAAGTGSQRVVDVASGTTGIAPPTQAAFIGGLISGATGGFLGGVTVGDSSKAVNVSTATTTLMITGVSGRQVRITSFHLVTAAANNVAWLEGTGATCGTGTAGMAGGTTAASGYNFAANGGIALGSGVGEVLTTVTTGDSVCLITSAATQLSGFIKYAIY